MGFNKLQIITAFKMDAIIYILNENMVLSKESLVHKRYTVHFDKVNIREPWLPFRNHTFALEEQDA